MNDDAPPGVRTSHVLIMVGIGCAILCMIGGVVFVGAVFFLGASRRSMRPVPVPVPSGPAQQAGVDVPVDEGPARIDEPARTTLTLAPRAGGEAELETAAAVLRQRLAGLGIDGRVAVADGKLRVEVPGAAIEQAMSVLTAGGRLQFKIAAALEAEPAMAEIARIGSLKLEKKYDEKTEAHDVAAPPGGDPILVENPGVEGFLVTKVYPTQGGDGTDAIGFEFGEKGTAEFHDMTGKNVNRELVVILDGEIQTMATIQEAISGSAVMSKGEGGYAADERARLITVMSSGRLPIELDLEGE